MSKTYEITVGTYQGEDFKQTMKEQLTHEISRISTLAQSEMLAKLVGGSVDESCSKKNEECDCEDPENCECEEELDEAMKPAVYKPGQKVIVANVPGQWGNQKHDISYADAEKWANSLPYGYRVLATMYQANDEGILTKHIETKYFNSPDTRVK